MKYQTYPAYKDSGVEFLGLIPKSWIATPVKHIGNLKGGAGFPHEEQGVSNEDIDFHKVNALGKAYQNDFLEKSENTISKAVAKKLGAFIFPEKSIVFAKVGAALLLARIRWLNAPACIDNNMMGFVVHETNNSNFIRYAMNLIKFDYIVNPGAVPSLNEFQIGNMLLAVPTKQEQQKIAQFLDHETAKIDTLIEKQQRLIELLKEKRQAVISHAVTKGLNPNAPMKDSGVEWLGEVPEHWIICRLKHIKSTESNAFVDGPFGSNLKSEHFIDDGDVYVIESNFATTGKIDASNLKQISQQHFETIKRSETKDGDIILAKIGARYGSSSILPKLDRQAVVSGNSLKLTVNPSLISNEYANEFLCILKANDAMDEGVNVTAQPALSLGGLNNLPFLRIPLVEQNQIIDHVKRIKTKFDELGRSAELFIQLIQERRTALISAAVTGKIDVREWDAPNA
jgi:type I restriction enzyme S subunit